MASTFALSLSAFGLGRRTFPLALHLLSLSLSLVDLPPVAALSLLLTAAVMLALSLPGLAILSLRARLAGRLPLVGAMIGSGRLAAFGRLERKDTLRV